MASKKKKIILTQNTDFKLFFASAKKKKSLLESMFLGILEISLLGIKIVLNRILKLISGKKNFLLLRMSRHG